MTKLVITDCSIRNLPTFFIPLLYFLVGIIYCQIARTAITRFNQLCLTGTRAKVTQEVR